MKILCKFEIGYKEQHREINNRYLLDESIKSGFNLEKNTKLTCANQNLGVERLVNHEPYLTISSDLTMPNKLGNLKKIAVQVKYINKSTVRILTKVVPVVKLLKGRYLLSFNQIYQVHH